MIELVHILLNAAEAATPDLGEQMTIARLRTQFTYLEGSEDPEAIADFVYEVVNADVQAYNAAQHLSEVLVAMMPKKVA